MENITPQQIEGFRDVLLEIMKQPNSSLSQHIFENYFDKYKFLFELFLSLSLEADKIGLKTQKNSISFVDLEKDLGKIIYHYLNNDLKSMQKALNGLFYPLQQILFLVFNRSVVRKLTEFFILEKIEHYYRLDEIVNMIEFPDLVAIEALPVQNIEVNRITELTFPCYIYKVKSGFKVVKLAYAKKESGKFISNISQGKLRNDLLNLNIGDFSLLGILTRHRKFKRKYHLFIFYFSFDSANAVEFMKGKGKFDNQLDEIESFVEPAETLSLLRGKKLNSKEEFINFAKKIRSNFKFVLQTETSVSLLKTEMQYVNVPIVDYIYNEEFDPIGLKIKYKNKIYDIYANIVNTSYMNGIENRFVRVGVIEMFDEVIKIVYNNEVYKWHKDYSYCVICEKVDCKYKYKGVCSCCYHQLYEITKNISGTFKEKCDKIFELVVNGCYIKSDGKELVIKPMYGKQLHLPLFDFEFCKEK